MPKVGIVMGSDSDLSMMSKTADILDRFGVEYEMSIISAHRAPIELFDWATGAVERGVKVIIAGAGMAAHLPGVCAALFPLPVIGVPMYNPALGGMDALGSVVQMPPGVPVATVGLNATVNAGLMAVKMLAISDDGLREKLTEYIEEMRQTIVAKDVHLKAVGHKDYKWEG